MRVVSAILVAALAFAVAHAQDGAQQPAKKVVSSNFGAEDQAAAAPMTTTPKIVESFDGEAKDEPKDNAVEVPNYAAPGAKGEAEPAMDSHFEKLESQLDQNQQNLQEITKQVAQSLHERKRLLLVGEEMHALMSLHKAAKMLNENQKEIDAVEEEIKKLGEEAEELIRQRTELKKQLEDEIAEKDSQLEETRGKLGELSKQLDTLHEEHDHAARLVSAWEGRAKAIRSAREKHEELDAMDHMMGAQPADEVGFPAGHAAAEGTPDISASETDIAKIEQSINDFVNKHVHGGKAAPAEAAAAPKPAEAAAAPKPAEQPAFAEMHGSSLLTHNH